jgi:anti-sigma-K factor RskA
VLSEYIHPGYRGVVLLVVRHLAFWGWNHVSSEESRNRHGHQDESDADSVSDMLPAFVFGVLDADDIVTVETAIAASPQVRFEYERYLQAVDELTQLTPLVAPPERLRSRIAASISDETATKVVPLRRSRLPRLLAAVAATMVVVLGGTVALLFGEVRERDDQIASLEAVAANRAAADFTQPLVWSTISSDGTGSPAKGYFCRTEDGSVGWIIVEGMHMDENHVYQLWLVDGDQHVSGGMFATDEAGRGFGVVRVGVPVHTFSQIWITVEPPGGSPQPTTDPDLKAPIV